MASKTGRRVGFALAVLTVATAHFLFTGRVIAAAAVGALLGIFSRDLGPDPTVSLLVQVLLFPLYQIHSAVTLPHWAMLGGVLLISLTWGLVICSLVRAVARQIAKSRTP
jgi:hypothetical protein